MAIKDQAVKVQYTAWDTANNVGKTGDSGNHSLSLRLGGVTDSSLDNSPAEGADGEYEIQLTAAEIAVAGMATLFGSSSTENVVIIPTRFYVYDGGVFKADVSKLDATVSSRATAADQAAIKAKTDRIGSVAVQVTSPVAEDGTVDVVEGDDYKGSLALSWTFEDWAGPAMTSGAAVELLIMTTSAYEAGTGTAAKTVVGDFSVNGTTVTITAELTSAETAALGPTPPADAFAYTYQIRCTASGGEIFTPALGAMTVMRRVDPAS